MNLIRGSTRIRRILNPTIATVGNFDGLHLGHQKIIRYVTDRATTENLESVLVSFEPTPKEYFMGENAPSRIYSLRDRFVITKSLGIQHFVCLRFNADLAKLHAGDFVKNILVDALNIKSLIVGDDFRFGNDRQGDIALLQNMGPDLGFAVEDKSTISHEDTRVSSSLIRSQLAAGEFDKARKLLGRSYAISGRVFHGDKKGRTIGFPTANLLLNRKVPPVRGVFVVSVKNSERTWQGVANVGHRPTINGVRDQLEVHLFDCNDNLYGQRLTVTFLARLRDEQKFSSFDELKHQISLDTQQAKQFFLERT